MLIFAMLAATKTMDVKASERDYTVFLNETDGKLYTDYAYTTLYTDNAGKWSTSKSKGSNTYDILTLNGFKLTSSSDTALVVRTVTTIVLADGSINTVKCTSETLLARGIWASAGESGKGIMTITGSGTLDVIVSNKSDTVNCFGIIASGGMSITGGASVNVSSDTCGVDVAKQTGATTFEYADLLVDAESTITSNGGDMAVNGNLKVDTAYANLDSATELVTGTLSMKQAEATASVNQSGKGAVTYSEADKSTYKWLKVSPIKDVKVTGITVGSAGDVSEVTEGEKLQMSASVAPENATDKTYTWSVEEKTGKASIDENVLLTATAEGVIIAKATANDRSGIAGMKEITIKKGVASVEDNTETTITNDNSANTPTKATQPETAAPQTGDSNTISLWGILVVAGLCVVFCTGKKERNILSEK